MPRHCPQRQARGLRRRRAGLADGGARPGAAGLRVTVFDGEAKAGGFIRTPDPALPPAREVIDEETGYILDLGVEFKQRPAHRLDEGAAGRRATTRCSSAAARRAGATWTCPAARRRPRNIHIGIDWLASVSFGHITSVGKRVIVLGGGNTAMDCCRSARRLGGDRREGGRAQRLRGDEGLALGEGRRHARGHPDPQLPCAQGLRARGRQAVRHDLRDRGRAVYDDKGRAAWCPPASRRFSSATRCWSPSARRTPSPGSSAMRHRVRQVGPAGARQEDLQSTRAATCSSAATRLRAQEHHHRRGPRPRGGGVDRPLPARRGRGPAPGAARPT
jgi:hypothetical protein